MQRGVLFVSQSDVDLRGNRARQGGFGTHGVLKFDLSLFYPLIIKFPFKTQKPHQKTAREKTKTKTEQTHDTNQATDHAGLIRIDPVELISRPIGNGISGSFFEWQSVHLPSTNPELQ